MSPRSHPRCSPWADGSPTTTVPPSDCRCARSSPGLSGVSRGPPDRHRPQNVSLCSLGMDWSPCSSGSGRSEEHTSELQSHSDLVCRLLLEKKERRYTLKTA